MSIDNSFLVQKQVKDNSSDLQSEFLDLKNWEDQMKRKDQELRGESNERVLPPIRSKKKKTTSDSQNAITKEKKFSAKPIKSSDYSAWEKFDAEEACKKIDKSDKSPEESGEEELTEEELRKCHDTATKHKQNGNMCVQRKEWDKAIGFYCEAIKIFPYDAIFFANRALCHLKKNNLYMAENDCTTAIRLDSMYVKAYHRRATARMELKRYENAKQDLEKILKLEPSNKEVQAMLAEVNKKLEATKSVSIPAEKVVAAEKTSIEKKIGEKMWNSNDKISKKVNNDRIEKNIENKVTKNEVKYMKIPDWLPEKDNVEIVEPITKPPHLQSKKSMKHIIVKDAEFGVATYKKENVQTCTDQQSEPFNTVDKKIVGKSDTSIRSDKAKELSIDMPCVPKTAVQFLLDWRRNNSSEYHYQYLKRLLPHSLPKIFQDSMESDIFGAILNTLRLGFIPRKEMVYEYLKALTNVKRFRTLVMFIGNSGKEEIKVLIEYCKNTEDKSEEEIEELRKAYEI